MGHDHVIQHSTYSFLDMDVACGGKNGGKPCSEGLQETKGFEAGEQRGCRALAGFSCGRARELQAGLRDVVSCTPVSWLSLFMKPIQLELRYKRHILETPKRGNGDACTAK